jgi:hypothetical protein
MKTDAELFAEFTEAMTHARKLHAQAEHIRLLKLKHEAEVTRMQADIDLLVTERIEREFVNFQLDKRVQELEGLVESFWQEVRTKMPEGL